jgi:DNA polymerase-3 subunit beta
MKIEQFEIADKLKVLSNAALEKWNVVHGVLFKGNTLTANSFELGITAKLDTQTDEEFVIPDRAIEMIANMKNRQIEITQKGERLTVKSDSDEDDGGIKATFTTIAPEAFPEMFYNPGQGGGIGIEGFAREIERVIFACSGNSDKKKLNGILFDGDGDYLNIVACDGVRLAWNRVVCDENIRAIIPKQAVKLALSIGASADNMSIQSGESNACIRSAVYAVYTRLIDGEYLDYRRLCDSSAHNIEFMLPRRRMIDCLTRAIICQDRSIKSPVVIEVKGNTVSISIKESMSEFCERLVLDEASGGDIRIVFNPKYLIEALKALNSDKVKALFKDATSSIMLVDGDFTAVVVPMRL